MNSDFELVQIVDRALAEAARRSGSWLFCRPGCTQCCYGPFEISQLEAYRLRKVWPNWKITIPSAHLLFEIAPGTPLNLRTSAMTIHARRSTRKPGLAIFMRRDRSLADALVLRDLRF